FAISNSGSAARRRTASGRASAQRPLTKNVAGASAATRAATIRSSSSTGACVGHRSKVSATVGESREPCAKTAGPGPRCSLASVLESCGPAACASRATRTMTVAIRMPVALSCVMAVVVRQFTPRDASACGAIVGATPLWQRADLGAARAAALLTAAAEAGDTVVVLTDGDAIDGFAWIDRRGAFGRSSYLRMIAVAPARRGAGLGTQL